MKTEIMNLNKTTYYRGKVARLPHGVREEVNLRLAHSVVKLSLTMREQEKEKMAQAWEEIKNSDEYSDAVTEMLGRKIFGNNW